MPSLLQALMMKRRKVALVAAFICLVVSILLASAKVAIRGGFGAGDLVPFFLWTLPLSVFVALIRNTLDSLLRAPSSPLTYVLNVFAGTITGVLWTYLVAFRLGSYFDAFSFEVLSCWIVGAASGLIVTSDYHHGRGRSLPISLVIVVVLCFVGLVGDKPLFSLLSTGQRLEVVIVKWTPGSQVLSNPPVLGSKLTDADLEQLKSIGLTGLVESGGSGFFGEGKRGKTIIVISQQLKQPTTLAQPDGCELIHLQTPEGWKTYPTNAATLSRTIELWPDEREPERVTRYAVQNADGSRQGGTLVTW